MVLSESCGRRHLAKSVEVVGGGCRRGWRRGESVRVCWSEGEICVFGVNRRNGSVLALWLF